MKSHTRKGCQHCLIHFDTFGIKWSLLLSLIPGLIHVVVVIPVNIMIEIYH